MVEGRICSAPAQGRCRLWLYSWRCWPWGVSCSCWRAAAAAGPVPALDDGHVGGQSGGDVERPISPGYARRPARVEAVDQLNPPPGKAAYFSLQHLGVVRYNPFHDTGGDQSFAIALVDGHGSGVVLSSLHARDVTRVYAKPLQKWESTYSLTGEEKQAIALAYQSSRKPPRSKPEGR